MRRVRVRREVGRSGGGRLRSESSAIPCAVMSGNEGTYKCRWNSNLERLDVHHFVDDGQYYN